MAPLPVSHRCAHRLYTLATTHRAFTMGVNKPYPSLSSHLTLKACSSERACIHSLQCESHTNFWLRWKEFQSPLWTLYAFLKSAVLTYTVSETVWKLFIGLVFPEILFYGVLPITLIYSATSEAKDFCWGIYLLDFCWNKFHRISTWPLILS